MQPVPPSALAEEDPFKYGWRFVKRTLPDGTEDLEQVPLTLEDNLHPQEGDVIPEASQHEMDRGYLAWVFRTRALTPPVGWVTSDLLIDWGIPGLKALSPDVAVFVGLRETPELSKGTLWLGELGGRCLLAIEVVSPDRRVNDVQRKVELYHRVGVPLYAIIDQSRVGGPRSLVAYQHAPGGYEVIRPDAQGRVLLPFLGLFLTMRDNHPVCIDAATGREQRNYVQLNEDLEAADRRSQEHEHAMEESVEARHHAERARLAAEQKARDERKAREDAEQKARDERKAREDAEQKARDAEQKTRDEQTAREDAEQKARDAEQKVRDEQKTREDAEQKARDAQAAFELRIRQLEDALRAAQGGSPSA